MENEPCIIAPGKPKSTGYHRVWDGGKMVPAHRFAYIAIYGPPPPDKSFILHKCNNRECWNPSHLYAGTQQDNMQDAIKAGTHRNLVAERNKAKTHCPYGHEYTTKNTKKCYGKEGRDCKACDNIRHKLSRAAL